MPATYAMPFFVTRHSFDAAALRLSPCLFVYGALRRAAPLRDGGACCHVAATPLSLPAQETAGPRLSFSMPPAFYPSPLFYAHATRHCARSF